MASMAVHIFHAGGTIDQTMTPTIIPTMRFVGNLR
jgi:hypothetical protein